MRAFGDRIPSIALACPPCQGLVIIEGGPEQDRAELALGDWAESDGSDDGN